MRRVGSILAVAVVVLANLIALTGVARNRAGQARAEMRLTERELPLAPWTDESTGIFLRLEWQRSVPGSEIETPWFDRAKLESLNFDCSYPAEGKDAREHYGGWCRGRPTWCSSTKARPGVSPLPRPEVLPED